MIKKSQIPHVFLEVFILFIIMKMCACTYTHAHISMHNTHVHIYMYNAQVCMLWHMCRVFVIMKMCACTHISQYTCKHTYAHICMHTYTCTMYMYTCCGICTECNFWEGGSFLLLPCDQVQVIKLLW